MQCTSLGMLKKLSSWILYSKLGWHKDVTAPLPDKFIICLAPHTSNWDFFFGQLYTLSEGIKINFLMKREWFFWPLGPLFKSMGGIHVWRDKHASMTDNLANEATKSDSFRLCITPEGTRSPNADWKKGFYYIALKAKIPILLFGVDYEKKRIQCTRSFIPTGDFDKEMKEIKLYYKDFKGKIPENFILGDCE